MFELAVAVGLILLNALFSLSELAVVSARKARLKTLAAQGRAGAAAALRLSEEPGRFLSTVQIGITLIGILAGAFSGAALGDRLTGFLAARGLPALWAEPLGYGVVIGTITYLSVVVGELVPKSLALKNAEAIACLMAPAMAGIARLGAPVVWGLDASTRLVLRVLGPAGGAGQAVTAEEIRTVVAEAATAGVIEGDEHAMISAVLRLGGRSARALMTPRTGVAWLDLDEGADRLRARLLTAGHSRLPVAEGAAKDMAGVVQVRELVPLLLEAPAPDVAAILRACVRPAPVVLDTAEALDVLTTLRQSAVPMALVHDEYGHFEGIVTPADILDAIAGAFRSDEGGGGEEAVRRADGSWLIAGAMPVDEMAERIGLVLPEKRSYHTAAGLVLGALEHLPATGEVVEAHGWRFEVVDLDGRRVDKILASRAPGA